jgi:hypothetical protein
MLWEWNSELEKLRCSFIDMIIHVFASETKRKDWTLPSANKTKLVFADTTPLHVEEQEANEECNDQKAYRPKIDLNP